MTKEDAQLYSAAVKLNNLVITSFTTIGNGISNFSAQNLGAGKYDRIRECFYAGIKMVWCLCVPFCILYLFFGNYLLLLFMGKGSADAMMTGRQFLWILLKSAIGIWCAWPIGWTTATALSIFFYFQTCRKLIV